MCEHGHWVAECGFCVVSEVLVFSDSHTFAASFTCFSNDGWEHHVRNVACSLVGPCAYDAVNVNVHRVVLCRETTHAALATSCAAVVGDGLVEERGGCAFNYHEVAKHILSDVAHLDSFGFNWGVFALLQVAVSVHHQFRFTLIGGLLAVEASENLVAILECNASSTIEEGVASSVFSIDIVAVLCEHGHRVGKFHLSFISHCLVSSDVGNFGSHTHHISSSSNVAHLAVEGSDSLHGGVGSDSDRSRILGRVSGWIGAIEGVVDSSASGASLEFKIEWTVVSAGLTTECWLAYHHFTSCTSSDCGFFEAPLTALGSIAVNGEFHC